MPPARARFQFPTLSSAAGIGAALATVALHVFPQPCLWAGGDCGRIIHSAWGSVGRLPVGVLALLLWLVVLLVPRGRLLALSVLAAGSVGFLAVQLFVLRGFCAFCTLHALACFLALASWRTAPTRLSLLYGAVLGAALYWLPPTFAPADTADLSPRAQTVAWPLASSNVERPLLLLSLDCPACLDLLAQLPDAATAPTARTLGLLWKTTPATEELTAALLAAAETQGGDWNALSNVWLVMQPHRSTVLTNPAGARLLLEEQCPYPPESYHAMLAWVQRQRLSLPTSTVVPTPSLHPLHGPSFAPTSWDFLAP